MILVFNMQVGVFICTAFMCFLFSHRPRIRGSLCAPCSPLHNLLFVAEPILTRGSTDCVMWEDKWTTVTADGGVCAQFKHTVLITRSGAETLTKC